MAAMSDMARGAYHEAGHASVATVQGFCVTNVQLTTPTDGFTDYEWHRDAPLDPRLTAAIAGYVSEGRALDCGDDWRAEVRERVKEHSVFTELGLSDSQAAVIGFEDDATAIAYMLRDLDEADAEREFNAAWERADAALSADAADARAIAESLARGAR